MIDPRLRTVPPLLNEGSGQMNRLEKGYSELLELLKKSGEIVEWMYEPVKLRLAYKTFYTPDFLVIKKECMEFHETKGFMRDDAAVKLKCAAQIYPWFRFILIKREKQNWIIKEIKTT